MGLLTGKGLVPTHGKELVPATLYVALYVVLYVDVSMQSFAPCPPNPHVSSHDFLCVPMSENPRVLRPHVPTPNPMSSPKLTPKGVISVIE